MKKEDYVICIKATNDKINIDFLFQSVTDENKFYHLKREVMTMILKKMILCIDNPLILKITYNEDTKQVYDIRYGFKDYDSYLKKEKDLFFNKPISTVFNNLFAWICGPIIMTIILILILNCFYNWWFNWGDWFTPFRP